MTNPINPMREQHSRESGYDYTCDVLYPHERSRRIEAEKLLAYIFHVHLGECNCEELDSNEMPCGYCRYYEFNRNIAEATKS